MRRHVVRQRSEADVFAPQIQARSAKQRLSAACCLLRRYAMRAAAMSLRVATRRHHERRKAPRKMLSSAHALMPRAVVPSPTCAMRVLF